MTRTAIFGFVAKRAIFAFFSTLCASILTHAQSQPYTPTPVYQGLNVFIDGQALYVLGGKHVKTEVLLSQMFQLDLTTSWSTSNPAFRKLPDGYTDFSMPNALTADKQTWFILSNRTAYAYKLETSIWMTLDEDSDISMKHGNAATTDPDTGRIYALNGYSDLWGGKQSMMIYSASNNTFYYTSMQPSLLEKRLYAVTWSPALKGMIIFGGMDLNTNISTSDLLLYQPKEGWRLLETKGDIPPARRSHCVVPAYSGSKMVLFGGNGNHAPTSEGSRTLGDIYILDVPSLTWTRGSDIGLAGARWGHACAMSNDYFIAWGGSTLSTAMLYDTIVYDLKSASWTTEYVYLPPPKQMDKKVIVIGCGVAGAVLFLVGAILIFRRHQAKKRRPPPVIVEVPMAIELVSPHPYMQPEPQLFSVPLNHNYQQHQPFGTPQPWVQGEYSAMSLPSGNHTLTSPISTYLSATPAPATPISMYTVTSGQLPSGTQTSGRNV